MRRRLCSGGLVFVLATTMLVGLRPTPVAAAEGVQSIVASFAVSPSPPTTGPFCAVISSSAVLMQVVTAAYAGPATGGLTGTICGTWPLSVTGAIDVHAFANAGVVTVTVTCTGTISGSLPGTVTYALTCVLTVTTPFGTTNQTLCIIGVGTLILSPGIFVGTGVSPCP